MSFHTDVVAINLRDYPHSPALLADLCREGYELFNPDGHVFFRRHNRLASTPVTANPPAAPPPAPARTAPAAAAPEPDDEEEYGPEWSPADDPEPEATDVAPAGIDYDVLAARVYTQLQKKARSAPMFGFR